MNCALMLIAIALGCVEASTLAEMVSNYAKVSTNTGLTPTNRTEWYESPKTEATNETDYEDFDDLEDESGRQQSIETGNVMKYVSGLVSLLSLMYNYRGDSSVGEARYVPDAATKKFKHQTDPEVDPISNFPPYNPLSANSAESYSQNGGKTSFDSDREQYQSDQQGWNVIGHDYPVYEPMKTWQKNPEPKQPWQQTGSNYPSFESPHPEKSPVDYHEYLIPEDDHHHVPPHHYVHHEVEDEDRESKRPYSYYFLGRKLWYIPLIFSVYFIIYVGALVLKSVARHKIQFPDKLWDLKDEHHKHRRHRKVDEITEKFEKAIDNVKYKFM